MGIAGSIFLPHPPISGKNYNFWRFTNDITIIFGNFYFYKSLKKYTQAIRPGVEESLINRTDVKILQRSLSISKPDELQNKRPGLTIEI